MAIAFANLGVSAAPDINSGADATSYASASWTPPTDGLILLYISSRNGSGLNSVVDVTGNSLTWIKIAEPTFDAGTERLSLFAADATGATTGATTINYGANTQLHCAASFFQATDIDLSGGVAAAFVQTPSASGTGTSGSVTLAAASDANNRPISAFDHRANEASTERVNWTEFDDLAGAGSLRSLGSQVRSDAFETTASATWTTSAAWGGLAAELKATGAAPPTEIPILVMAPPIPAGWRR